MTERKYNGGEWSVARFNSFVKSALRSASQRWPPKYKCLHAAKVGKKINWKTSRVAEHYKCNSCNKEFVLKDVQVNHISPVVPLTGFTTWDEVIERLFCEQDKLEVLCIPCHKEVSKREKELRKEFNTVQIKATYQCWLDMKARCFNEKAQRYYTHGARGITVCENWKYSFDNFLKDMGEKPDGYSLERVDNNGDYTPDNCKWATPREQALNRRTNVLIEYGGETHPVSVWAARLGLSFSALMKRLQNWENMEDIMSPDKFTRANKIKKKEHNAKQQ